METRKWKAVELALARLENKDVVMSLKNLETIATQLQELGAKNLDIVMNLKIEVENHRQNEESRLDKLEDKLEREITGLKRLLENR
jgi:3-deoxy-D-manno-octulosonic-acid transferase